MQIKETKPSTLVITKYFCDNCEKEILTVRSMNKCVICGKELCYECLSLLDTGERYDDGDIINISVCKNTHKDLDDKNNEICQIEKQIETLKDDLYYLQWERYKYIMQLRKANTC